MSLDPYDPVPEGHDAASKEFDRVASEPMTNQKYCVFWAIFFTALIIAGAVKIHDTPLKDMLKGWPAFWLLTTIFSSMALASISVACIFQERLGITHLFSNEPRQNDSFERDYPMSYSSA